MKNFIMYLLVVMLFFSIIVPVVSQSIGADSDRYISRFEAAEMVLGRWEHYGSHDLDQGDSHLFSEPYSIEFFPGGGYVVETKSGEVLRGSWETLEIDYRPWIRMSLESVQQCRTFRMIFSDGELKLHDPFILSGLEGFDTELFRRPDRSVQ